MAVASAPEYGGYDYKFAGKVPERFLCNICTKVLREPHLTVCCGQHFCESCLENWFKKRGKKSCPHCREENFNHFLNKERKRDIFELKIHCTYHKGGCWWIGELGSIETHLNSKSGCGYVEVECSNKCQLRSAVRKFQRKALQDHLENECTRRSYKCEYCGHEDTYKDITGIGYRNTYDSHYNTCDMYPLDCPNKCGKKQIQRKDMSAHRDKCPEERVKCPFEAEGCRTRMVRKDFDNHMATQIQQHLLLMKMKHDEDRKKQESELNRTMRGISMNVDSLLQNCTEDQKQPLQSIRALIDKSHHLKEEGDSLTIEVLDLHQYKRNGRVWRSPPFYIKDGYKMHIAVYPNDVGKAKGTHICFSLVLMKGEFDDKLKWPIRCDCNELFLEVEVMPKHKVYSLISARFANFDINGLNRVHDNHVVQSREIFHKHGIRDEQEMIQARVKLVYYDYNSEIEMESDPDSDYDDDD